jgi:hypothetical protein
MDSRIKEIRGVAMNSLALTFTYGVDRNNDGIMDDQNGNGQGEG